MDDTAAAAAELKKEPAPHRQAQSQAPAELMVPMAEINAPPDPTEAAPEFPPAAAAGVDTAATLTAATDVEVNAAAAALVTAILGAKEDTAAAVIPACHRLAQVS